ncbi:DDE Tnp4 domain-containing protein [Mycena sanguinolenta]|uniref:DDE Tnp4 domain-containing protein n=1 Tax=Mycena sanguinolenta TaxID=230812 RepID=A0A8H6YZI4_9AGAR|nr:DDE Tnp4 domain-containing protein [Mycena sanguinolenta]
MPKETLEGLQNRLYDDATSLFMLADLLEATGPIDLDPDDDNLTVDGDPPDELAEVISRGRSETADVLRMHGAMFVEEAESLRGDGTRGPYFQVRKSQDWFLYALAMPDRQFRAIFRIGRRTFDIFCEILEENPIFTSRGCKPQRHIAWQLGAFLIRYGQLGSPVLDTSLKLGIGYGTIILYCRCVTRAVRELKKKYAPWFSKDDHGDGSLIQTSDKPSWIGSAYLTRKGFFAYALFAIVDGDLRFGAWDLGWPGSVTDARVFKNSHFWRHRHQYLSDGRYILVDKGYPSTPFTVRPFSEPELAQASEKDRRRMKDFNFTLSSERIRVEHAFGCFKLRFQSARMMGIHKDVQDVWRALDALLVMHNMCLWHNDHPKHLEDYRDSLRDDDAPGGNHDEPEVDEQVFDTPDIPAEETAAWLKDRGLELRQQLLDQVFPEEDYK